MVRLRSSPQAHVSSCMQRRGKCQLKQQPQRSRRSLSAWPWPPSLPFAPASASFSAPLSSSRSSSWDSSPRPPSFAPAWKTPPAVPAVPCLRSWKVFQQHSLPYLRKTPSRWPEIAQDLQRPAQSTWNRTLGDPGDGHRGWKRAHVHLCMANPQE